MKKKFMENFGDELRSIDQRLDKIAAEQTEPKNQFGDTAADKERLATAWITSPRGIPLRPIKKATAKKKPQWKYEGWNGKTEPERENILTYVDRVRKENEN